MSTKENQDVEMKEDKPVVAEEEKKEQESHDPFFGIVTQSE